MSEDLAEVRTEVDGDRLIVAIRGEVDLSNAETVEQRIHAALADQPTLVVDLTELRYMDSRGVRLLYELARSRVSGQMIVVAPADSVAGQLLEVTRMVDLVPVVETMAAATS